MIPNEIILNGQKYYSYASVEDADTYLGAKFGSTWSTKTDDVKKQLLITATRMIDYHKFAGAKLEANQPLQFPRQFRDGSLSDDELVTNCCVEVADSLGTTGTTTTDTAMFNGVKSYQVGDVKVEMKTDAAVEVTTQEDIIANMLGAYMTDIGGAKIWL